MNFHVWGPISVRHNDLFSLDESNISDELQKLMEFDELKFCVYGDSAYIVGNYPYIKARHDNEINNPREILENRSMSSCRECIEWDYGNVGTMWPLVDYSKVLKIRKMPVAKMYITAMIMRNAYVTINGCETTKYFNCVAPTLECWLAQGPKI